MAYVSSRKHGLSAQAVPNIIRRNSTSEHTYKRLVASVPELKDVEPLTWVLRSPGTLEEAQEIRRRPTALWRAKPPRHPLAHPRGEGFPPGRMRTAQAHRRRGHLQHKRS